MANNGEDLRFHIHGRRVERNQGCWSCRHFDREAARDKWIHQRQRDLQRAVEGALVLTGGENHEQIKNIRRMVDTLDHAIASGKTGLCRIGAVETDFVNDAFLCPSSWSAADGANDARGGAAPDKPSAELAAEAKAADEKAAGE